ncbi:MAG: sigma-54-dependent Fis family transcriptional regulator [Desulfatitalea sp.]|nr:sigma-54 dependent transcriptional regulator [Desulfatitalea sp.]NNK02438.1 sigma-54-dependent Fis family transcriptional regulator [Desulfatitalea sp.]
MQSVRRYLVKVASSASTVLITGETGTGKELAADFIHRHSRRAGKPMVTVNCAALPESLTESELFGYERGAFTGAVAKQPGKFAMADGGTIFLDEIGDMRPLIQAKILHAIERKTVYPLGADKPRQVDARIIAATNQELERLIIDGRFREDLYYRLNIARINLPPLRERKEDIHELLTHGVHLLNSMFSRHIKGLTPEAKELLTGYDWPGNVRELMNLLEAAFINLPAEPIDYLDLPVHFKKCLHNSKGCSINERRRIVDTLMQTRWNKSQVAEKLNWSRMTLYRKMAMHKIIEKRIGAFPVA